MLKYITCCFKNNKPVDNIPNKFQKKDFNGEVIFENIEDLKVIIKKYSQN